MTDEIELISDGDGIAVIGDATVVDRFLTSQGLPSKDLRLSQLGSTFSAGSGALQSASTMSANSGRWVQLTQESAQALGQSPLMKGSQPGVSRAILTQQNGQIKGILEIVRTPGSMLANPALLTGAAGIMAQLAMQQTMEEITDYLATIDAKVDDVLRAQKDAVLADMIGVDFVLEEAMTVREHTGRVSEVTWSKVQATALSIGRTQAYSLRQLDALAEKLERAAKMGDLAKAAQDAEARVQEWLAVLARCFQLQDALAVLELDRVLDASPQELDQHRIALRAARQNRLDLIAQCTARLLTRMAAAAGTANAKVLLHPSSSRTVVAAGTRVSGEVAEFHTRLGLDHDAQVLEARRWVEAATDVRDKAFETGADGFDTARRLGAESVGRARSVTGKFANGIAQRVPRRRGNSENEPPELEAPDLNK
ncbi:hypothetical protein LQF12_10090 [Ruania suaedae]|uniref:hypothetical protein n=1 Tax=Ruania suaedae TaxID=2897774 RepID=UPI001E2CC147|nr:hypothetical protein [Ruania suaedae]UFU01866.1 hypothetical protein LQF12_10090 [Ruania suaedae]